MYDDYVNLLDKYQTKQPGEKWSTESETRNTKNYRTKQYVRYLDYPARELKLTVQEKQEVEYIIETVPLKELHANLSYELIITSLCFIIKSHRRSIKPYEYRICNEYGLDWKTLYRVAINYLHYMRANRPLKAQRKDELTYE